MTLVAAHILDVESVFSYMCLALVHFFFPELSLVVFPC